MQLLEDGGAPRFPGERWVVVGLSRAVAEVVPHGLDQGWDLAGADGTKVTPGRPT